MTSSNHPPSWIVASGPAAGTRLRAGTSGRAELRDPSLAPHHICVLPDGSARTVVGSVGGRTHIDGVHALHLGSTTVVAVANTPRSRPVSITLHRTRRRCVDELPAPQLPVAPAAPPDRRLGQLLAGSAAATLMSIAIGVIIGRPLIALFALGGVATAGVGIIGDLLRRRRHRRAVRSHEGEVAEVLHNHRVGVVAQRRTVWPIDVMAVVASVRLWERRHDHDDAMRCVVGVDEHDLGVSVDLRGGAVLAVRGPGAVTAGVVRAVIAQALLWHGPADLGIVTDCDDLVRFIPETYRDHPRPMMVMLTDDVAALSHAISAPRRALGDGAAIIVRIPVGVDVPAVCTTVYDVAADYSGVLAYGDHIASPRVVAMTPELTSAVAAVTGRLIDPEHGGAALADAVPLSTLLGDTPPVGVVGVPLGVDDAGTVWCDPVSDGPHLLVAGTTGSGKSEALRALVVALCARHSPKHWQVCLIDAKGGAGLDVVADVPHVIGSVTDLDEGGIRRAIDGLAVEMRRREHVLRAGGHRDIASAGSAAPPRLLVVIDEFAAVIRGDERSRAVIIDIAQRGRSLGVHLVLATQRPAGSIPDDLRANLGACVCLRVNDRCDAVDVVGRPDAAEIPSSRPGRAMVRTPDGRYAAVQIAWVDDAADEAARQWAAPVHPVVPWLNPIASSLPADAQRRSLIVARPDRQRFEPHEWSVDDGALHIVGDRGAGTTTAAIAVCARLQNSVVYVLDTDGDARWQQLAQCSHVADPVDAHDAHARHRLLIHLDREIRRRRADPTGPAVVVVLDAAATLMQILDDRTGLTDAHLLRRVISDGPAVGIVTIAVGPPARVGIPAATQWRFRTCDPSLGVMPLGSRDERAPGHCRVWIDGAERDALVVPADIDAISATAHQPSAPAVPTIPTVVAASIVATVRDGGARRLRIGIDEDHQPIDIAWDPGSVVAITGPAGSGRHLVAEVLAAGANISGVRCQVVDLATGHNGAQYGATAVSGIDPSAVTVLIATDEQWRRHQMGVGAMPPGVRIHTDVVGRPSSDDDVPPHRSDLAHCVGVGALVALREHGRWRVGRLPAVERAAPTAMLVA
ncbi:MAG: FtsK/SpoIIIE domain-containing protein [Actinomycetota bacterium]|nr:FtsK/SpoIIIE domain-containing protein [Actinomycetota bacterium]